MGIPYFKAFSCFRYNTASQMFGKVLNTPVETRPRYLQRHSRKLKQYGRLEEF